ncbi:hypothetical protein [Micromonospora orduensis]|uniref:hypothetical protein n=1 Tax=Micromonospora orduensis TaxID=1420891 RepID=UPI0033D2C707
MLLLVDTVPGMTRIRLTATVLALAVALTGCGSDDEPAADPSPAVSSASPPPATALAADAYAQQACSTNAEAQSAGTGDDPAIMRIVADAAVQSTVSGVAAAGRTLAEQVTLVEAASGKGDEVAMKAGLAAGSMRLVTACANAGLVN